MVDTVNTNVIQNNGGRHYVAQFTNESDGTGETAVQKIDISSLTDAQGNQASYSAIDRIEFSVSGFSHVVLEWDHTANDEIAVLSGNGVKDWSPEGGIVDPQSAGGTGDIVLSTVGAAAGAAYDITVWLRPKA